ncbi:HpcH/HpaI aldolase/citrate lyase family protein [Nocardia rhizosphaerihabitans]|uniref:Citrate lyase subunit beta-like protein n=1 Tax=Nocardia rhizosphaerihabitans TaxID=1691570 RepID=A0ABQ2L1W4_9NOCA|nr:CoA ester lyase [Nocardia rhizosphaerihabitans]GGN99721.1 citrate lyase subunit beta-like protein [Nocardia rhizosphaerihabitans]
MSAEPTGPVWLFCPADRPERFAKAAACADMVILDLEDGVGEDAKSAARESVRECRLDPARTIIRTNPLGSAHFEPDIGVIERTPFRQLMLPKAETGDIPPILGGYDIVALVETPAGVRQLDHIARSPTVIALMWGAEDLVAALGGSSSRHASGTYRDVAKHLRSATLLAAKAHGKLAVDGVYLDIPDLDGLAAESADAVASGFDIKVALHPTQVSVIADAYRPDLAELDWARRILGAAEHSRGVFAVDGAMVDAPILSQARRIVARADGARTGQR